MIKVLSIAGSDPSGGAGIQLDLKVFQSLGAFGMAIPAALTVQNSRGVSQTYPVPGRILSAQFDALLNDIKPDAVKIGMLLTEDNVNAVAKAIRKYKIRNVVIDPVLRSSSGKTLLRHDAAEAMKRELFPSAVIVTPNLQEAEKLTGVVIKNDEHREIAAGILLMTGASHVLIKGGHIAHGPATDCLYNGKKAVFFSTPRRKGEFHGTGCALSSAIAVFIARGYPVEKAVGKAKQFVNSMLKTAEPVGKGKTLYFQF